MNKNVKLSTIFEPIINVFKNYSLTIFIVVLVAGLGAAVLTLSSALQKASDTSNYTPASTGASSFDKTTIDRINQLYSSSDAPLEYTPPSGRINPFSE